MRRYFSLTRCYFRSGLLAFLLSLGRPENKVRGGVITGAKGKSETRRRQRPENQTGQGACRAHTPADPRRVAFLKIFLSWAWLPTPGCYVAFGAWSCHAVQSDASSSLPRAEGGVNRSGDGVGGGRRTGRGAESMRPSSLIEPTSQFFPLVSPGASPPHTHTPPPRLLPLWTVYTGLASSRS